MSTQPPSSLLLLLLPCFSSDLAFRHHQTSTHLSLSWQACILFTHAGADDHFAGVHTHPDR
jgi:hypothetical protein